MNLTISVQILQHVFSHRTLGNSKLRKETHVIALSTCRHLATTGLLCVCVYIFLIRFLCFFYRVILGEWRLQKLWNLIKLKRERRTLITLQRNSMCIEKKRLVGKYQFLEVNFSLVFTALHVMQTRYCDEISARLSVRPSVCHTRGLWQNKRKIGPDFYTIRKNI